MMALGRVAGENRARFSFGVPRWTLWSLNTRALAFIVGVILVGPALTAWAVLHTGLASGDLVRFGVLLIAAVAYGEACDRIERFRRFLGDDSMRTNHLSVWMVAGVVVLPPALAGALALLVHAHMLVMGHRHRSVRPHRMAFTGGAATLAALGAGTAVVAVAHLVHLGGELDAALASAVAVPSFFLIDMVLVATGVYLAARPQTFREVLPGRDGMLFELTTEGLGVLAAQLLLFVPWLFPSVFGSLIALHRASLVKQLQVAATTDPKTALLNAAAWRDRAQQALARAAREAQRVAVIVIDLDHFKQVNDVHGHLVGDRVLRSVAHVIRNETRARDIVGRFGGEEFVILVDGAAAAAHGIEIAARLRERIGGTEHADGVHVTATVGVAHGIPESGESLDRLLASADAALYEGKAAGRDRVRALVLS
jgi:diguanylate cyclase (GGDEF)-like protein